MKNADKSTKMTKSLDMLISKLTGKKILNLQAMSCVRGGDGNGSVPIIIIPPRP